MQGAGLWPGLRHFLCLLHSVRLVCVSARVYCALRLACRVAVLLLDSSSLPGCANQLVFTEAKGSQAVGTQLESPAPQPLLDFRFLFQKLAVCHACPFTKVQAYHSYCFQKNFLALSLKLNCPLRVSYFVCSYVSWLLPHLPSLLSDVRWERGGEALFRLLPSVPTQSRTNGRS